MEDLSKVDPEDLELDLKSRCEQYERLFVIERQLDSFFATIVCLVGIAILLFVFFYA